MKTIRVQIRIDGAATNYEFFVAGFTSVPRQKDFVDILEFVGLSEFKEEDQDRIYDGSWRVWFVSWKKDKAGVYASIYLRSKNT